MLARLFKLLPVFLFFFSGCASLIFETLCSRRLALVLGNTVHSASTTVAAFLFGLGVGAHLSRHIIKGSKNPLLVFALLEGSAGFGAVFVLWAIPQLSNILVPLAQNSPGLLSIARVTIVFLLLLLPGCAMGASLPVLSHYYVENLHGRFTSSLALLYSVNTLGAASGVLVCDFYLVERIGVTKTGWVSGGLYLLVALLSLFLSQVAEPSDDSAQEAPKLKDGDFKEGVLILVTTGYVGLSFQVLWTRMLTFFNGNDVFAFSTTLSVYLIGLVLGSAIIAALQGRDSRLRSSMGWIMTGLAVTSYSSLFTINLVRAVREWLEPTWLGHQGATFFSCALVILPPALCLGLLFPLATKQIQASRQSTAHTVGKAYILNTLGSVSGALIAGYTSLPTLGLQRSLALTSILTLVVAVYLLSHRHSKPLVLGLAAACLAGFLLTPADLLLRTVYGTEYPNIVFHTDDHYGSIALTRAFDPVLKQQSENFLVDGFNMAGNTPTAKRYTTGLAILPIAFAEEPSKVLIVCMGLGNTLNTAVSMKETEKVTCVELSHQVPKMLRLTEHGSEVLDNPKLKVIHQDGRNHLLSTKETYDVISAEPPPPTHAGIVNLYSREYYELCSSRLNEGGVVAQWLPVFNLSIFEAKTIIRAFQDVFPETYLWESSSHQLCLIGSKSKLSLDYQRLVDRLENNKEFLEDTGWHNPALFAALCLATPEQLLEYTKETPPLTDDWPRIQYSDHNFLADLNFFFFDQRDRDPGWIATEQQKEKIALSRTANLAFHIYSAANSDPRYPKMSSLERYDLANLAMSILPGYAFLETRFLATPAREEAFVETTSKEPTNAEAFFELARIRFLRGNLEGAAEAAAKASDIPSQRQNLHEMLALLIDLRRGQDVRSKFEALNLEDDLDSQYLKKMIDKTEKFDN